MHTYLISFQQNASNEAQPIHLPDLGEKVGQWGIGWLSLGFGEHVKVTSDASGILFETRLYPVWQRIGAVVAAILLFPISLPLAGIGCIGLAYSESHAALTTVYINYRALKKPQQTGEEGPPENLPPEDENVVLTPSATCQSPCISQLGRIQQMPKSSVGKVKRQQDHKKEGEIPPADDIRKKKWLANDNLRLYATKYLKGVNPKVHYIHTDSLSTATDHIDLSFSGNLPLPEAFALCPPVPPIPIPGLPAIPNHFVLVYICTKTCNIEYYDSKVDYGDLEKITADLEALAKKLYEKDLKKLHYNIVFKIKKMLQPDTYQCGPWALYFLEQRAKNPEVDFNELDFEAAQTMIAEFRLQIADQFDLTQV